MATKEEVKKLAALARISIADSELEKFTKEFDSILAYVGQLEKLELPKVGAAKPALRNVLRADGEPHESEKYTEKLVAQFPFSAPAVAKAIADKKATKGKPENGGAYLEVKQIISHD